MLNGDANFPAGSKGPKTPGKSSKGRQERVRHKNLDKDNLVCGVCHIVLAKLLIEYQTPLNPVTNLSPRSDSPSILK